MFPVAFDYRRATSIDEALALLREHGGEARILAGGQSLIPAMRFRLARPARLLRQRVLFAVRSPDGVRALRLLLPRRPQPADLLESRAANDRFVQETPLTEEERAAADGDAKAVDLLVASLREVSTPGGQLRSAEIAPGVSS